MKYLHRHSCFKQQSMDLDGTLLIILNLYPYLCIVCSGFFSTRCVYILTFVNSVLVIHNMYLIVITNDDMQSLQS